MSQLEEELIVNCDLTIVCITLNVVITFIADEQRRVYRVYNDVYTGGHSCSEWKFVTWSVSSDWGRSEREAKVIK